MLITFERREAALRESLRKMNKDLSVAALSRSVSVDEKVVREFIRHESKTSLVAKNFNAMVMAFASARMQLDILDFPSLVNLCAGLNPSKMKAPDVVIDFSPTYSEDDKHFEDLRDFLIINADIKKDKNGSEVNIEDKRGFLSIINQEDERDTFKLYTKIGKYRETFEKLLKPDPNKEFKIFIYGIAHQDFLLRGDDKEILLFLGSGKAFDPDSKEALTDAELSISGIDKSSRTINRVFTNQLLEPKQK